MSKHFTFQYPEYLAAKKHVDDHSLNRHVFETVKQLLPGQTPKRPLRILEIGAGIGTMIERLIEWNLLQFADYTAIDITAENIESLPLRLQTFAQKNSLQYQTDLKKNRLLLTSNETDFSVSVRPIQEDFNRYLSARPNEKHWDLVIANAMLDILPLDESLQQLFSVLRSDGLFWFTLNYNGITHFEPVIDPELDAQIEKLYNESMDRRSIETGGSETGRKLFQTIPHAGGKILAVGSSDWVLHSSDSEFNRDEQYFLQSILQMVYQTVLDSKKISKTQIKNWYTKRLRQVQDGSLVYIARQLDFCGYRTGNE